MKDPKTNEEMTWEQISKWCSDGVTVRQICCTLQASRQWVGKYVLPRIIDGNTDTGNYVKLGPKWAQVMQKTIGLTYPECIFMQAATVENILTEGVRDVQMRTITIDKDRLWESTEAKYDFGRVYGQLKKQLEELDSNVGYGQTEHKEYVKQYDTIKKQIETERLEHYSDDAKAMLEENERTNVQKRGDSKWVDVPELIDHARETVTTALRTWNKKSEDTIPRIMQSSADMRDYGMTDEMVYRKIWDSCRAKITLQLPDVNGVMSEKVYYIRNPWNESFANGMIVGYEIWQKYKDKLPKR